MNLSAYVIHSLPFAFLPVRELDRISLVSPADPTSCTYDTAMLTNIPYTGSLSITLLPSLGLNIGILDSFLSSWPVNYATVSLWDLQITNCCSCFLCSAMPPLPCLTYLTHKDIFPSQCLPRKEEFWSQ